MTKVIFICFLLFLSLFNGSARAITIDKAAADWTNSGCSATQSDLVYSDTDFVSIDWATDNVSNVEVCAVLEEEDARPQPCPEGRDQESQIKLTIKINGNELPTQLTGEPARNGCAGFSGKQILTLLNNVVLLDPQIRGSVALNFRKNQGTTDFLT